MRKLTMKCVYNDNLITKAASLNVIIIENDKKLAERSILIIVIVFFYYFVVFSAAAFLRISCSLIVLYDCVLFIQ